MSNLKQIVAAGQMYMDDAGQLILMVETNNADEWVGELSSYGATSNLLLCPSTLIPPQPESSGANVVGTASLAWCQWPFTSAAPDVGSYSINGWLFSYDPNITGIVSTWVAPPPQVVTLHPQFIFAKPTSVQRPAQTPFFNDAVVWNEWPTEGDSPAALDLSQGAAVNITGMPRCTIWRHGGKTLTSPLVMAARATVMPQDAAINIGFDDGHAELVKLNSLWSCYWHYNWVPSATPP